MTKVLAHRGFSAKYPENTMLAFEKAIQFGCDGLELDVQLTADNIPVIIHDETVDRTTNGTGPVVQYTYAQLKKLNAASAHASGGVAEIPRLADFFDLIRRTEHLVNIELKNGICEYEGLEASVIHLIRQYRMEERCVLSSFNHPSIVKCRELAPEIARSIITYSRLYNPMRYLESVGACGFQSYHASLHEDDMARFKRNQVKTYAWSPDTERDIKKMLALQVSYVITDHIDLYRQIVQKR